MSREIHPKVLEQCIRLGATQRGVPLEPDEEREVDLNSLLPSPMRTLMLGLDWPDDGRWYEFESGSMDWVIQLESGCRLCHAPTCEGRQMVEFGSAQYNSWMVVLDLADEEPDNPMLYIVDHFDPDEHIDDCAKGRLADILPAFKICSEESEAEEKEATDGQLAMHEELIGTVFKDAKIPLLSLRLALAQDFIDGGAEVVLKEAQDPLQSMYMAKKLQEVGYMDESIESVMAENPLKGCTALFTKFIEEAINDVNNPTGPWVEAVRRMREMSE